MLYVSGVVLLLLLLRLVLLMLLLLLLLLVRHVRLHVEGIVGHHDVDE